MNVYTKPEINDGVCKLHELLGVRHGVAWGGVLNIQNSYNNDGFKEKGR